MVVNQPLGWLYNFLVDVMISFSIVGFSLSISVLLIVVQSFTSVNMVSVTIIINSIFIDSENISFDASLATQINKTSIPPTKTINRMYWNQNL
jgi:hypothetical protein